MRSETKSRHSLVDRFEADEANIPSRVASWLTIGLLVLMLVLGALFLSGFFSSIRHGM